MKIVAVICGNIRDIIDFKLTLTRLLELKNEHRIDHIIFSTWENELDAHPELKENMRLANIDVVETPPLHERYTKIESNSVNYWRQARQIQSALDAIEGDCFILKTRTDRCLNFLNQIDWDNLTLEKTQALGQIKPVFEYKMSVFSPKMVRLFNLNDFIFIGYKRDIYKIINFDISELLLDRDIVANTQWFIYPFFKEYPIIKDYFRLINYRPLLPNLRDYVDKNKLESKFPALFYKTHAIYCALLYINFNIMNYDKKIIEKNIVPRHFYQIFSSLTSNEIIYSNIGSTIRSNQVIQDLIELDSESTTGASDHIWQKNIQQMKQQGNLYLELKDYEELKQFYSQKVYGEAKWLKSIKNPPRILLSTLPSNQVQVDFFAKNESHLKALRHSAQFDKDLYRLWLKKNSKIEEVDLYLLSYAKTGASFAILHLIRCLRQGRLADHLHHEVLRFSLYFPSIKDVRKNFNFSFLLITLNRYLAEPTNVEAKQLLIKYANQYLALGLNDDLTPKALYRIAQNFMNKRDEVNLVNSDLLYQFILEIAWNPTLYDFIKAKQLYSGDIAILNERYPA
jgi:hypothetical protein